MPLPEFGRIARDLSRNPLGIIALFVTLTYGIACLALGQNVLTSEQRTPLVWFLVAFPFAELGVFGWLVSRHHTKLYSPSDFRDERLFFVNLSAESHRARVEKEVDAIVTQNEARALPPAATAPAPNTLRDRVVAAEEFAFRAIESEFRVPIQRHVGIQAGKRSIETDGVFTPAGRPTTLVEVKYVPAPDISLLPLRLLLADVRSLTSMSPSLPTLDVVFAFVTEFSGETLAAFQARVIEYLSTEPDTGLIHLRFYPAGAELKAP